MNGLDLFEAMLRDMEETTIDDLKMVISECDCSNAISKNKISEVYSRYMEAVSEIRKETDRQVL